MWDQESEGWDLGSQRQEAWDRDQQLFEGSWMISNIGFPVAVRDFRNLDAKLRVRSKYDLNTSTFFIMESPGSVVASHSV